MSAKRTKIFGRVGCLVAAISSMLIAFWLLTHDTEPRLLPLSHAIPIQPILPDTNYTQPLYLWVTNQALLVFCRPSGPHGGFRVFRINTINNQETELIDLSQPQATQYNTCLKSTISADRKHLLLWVQDVFTNKFVTCRLDGSGCKVHVLSTVGEYRYPVTWTGDSRHWLEFYLPSIDGNYAVVWHGLNGEKKALGAIVEIGQPLGVDLNGRLLLYQEVVGTTIKHNLYTFDLTVGLPLKKQIALPIPVGGTSREVSLSPQGEKVALLIFSGGDARYPAWIGKLSSALKQARRPQKAALWICGIDGKGAHEIGCIRSDEDSLDIEQLAWLPDGKSISFLYNNHLRVVPVN